MKGPILLRGRRQPPAPHAFRTLRGALAGEEPDEEIYFAYSASLRIFGDIPDFEALSQQIGVAATRTQRRGEARGPRSPRWKVDGWFYESGLPEEMPLESHIDAVWTAVRGGTKALIALTATHQVSMFLGYRSNCDHAGFEVPAKTLEMFHVLQIPFGVSIIIA